MGYLQTKFKGIYRLKYPIDKRNNQFPRKLNGAYEDADVYIDCRYGNKVFHYGRSTLEAYIPSLGRGHNIVKKIEEEYGDGIIFGLHETDAEIYFYFDFKNSDKVIPLLKPKTNGANTSPFSPKNLPKNKAYKIPDEQLKPYKEIVDKLPKNMRIRLTHTTNDYIKTLATKKNPIEDIKSDMLMKGLKPKEYIHSICKWDSYIKFLDKNLEKYYEKN